MIKKRGFTLIEMLTVVVIVAILSAITMKLMGFVNGKMSNSRAARHIERVKHALAEFYHAYGCFPPVTTLSWVRLEGAGPAAAPDGGLGEQQGLCKYLYGDNAMSKWSQYLEGLESEDTMLVKGNNQGYGGVEWYMKTTTIRDPWGREYVYTTSPPYQSYKLYSTGPDKNDPSDDVGNAWTE